MTEWSYSHSRKVDHVMGAFYLVRRTLFETLHGFDERFFVYPKDLDFSLRAREAGWYSYYLSLNPITDRDLSKLTEYKICHLIENPDG
jgi:N-acetylglucosaminyl-diphospho-decaprenol L-rhamnosyltransferase